MHLSQIEIKDIFNLRKEQPWSWVYGVGGGGGKLEKKFREQFDRLYGIINPNRDLPEILEEIKQPTQIHRKC